jgi:hypothetical protein
MSEDGKDSSTTDTPDQYGTLVVRDDSGGPIHPKWLLKWNAPDLPSIALQPILPLPSLPDDWADCARESLLSRHLEFEHMWMHTGYKEVAIRAIPRWTWRSAAPRDAEHHSETAQEDLDQQHENREILRDMSYRLESHHRGSPSLSGDLLRGVAAGFEPWRGQCHTCGRLDLFQCGRCLGPRYCSRDCQLLDWPAHRASCRTDRMIC